MCNKLEKRVLVLNRNWMPINITTVYNAVCDVYGGRAKFVNPDTYATHDFDSWVDTWDDAVRQAKQGAREVISTSRYGIVVPEIITYLEYKGMAVDRRSLTPRFSRRNIFLRDKNQCQYCGQRFSSEDLNLDHVIPKSRGGCMSWANIVLSCIRCNTKKANRTPKEAGMYLVRTPGVPTARDLYRPSLERVAHKLSGDVPGSWEVFLGKMYWDVELEDSSNR